MTADFGDCGLPNEIADCGLMTVDFGDCGLPNEMVDCGLKRQSSIRNPNRQSAVTKPPTRNPQSAISVPLPRRTSRGARPDPAPGRARVIHTPRTHQSIPCRPRDAPGRV